MGEGVPQDFKEAYKWFRIAAERGNAQSQFSLGVMYANGQGVLKNELTAYAWWNIASASGHAAAKRYKGIITERFSNNEICKAQALSREMLKNNPKLLK